MPTISRRFEKSLNNYQELSLVEVLVATNNGYLIGDERRSFESYQFSFCLIERLARLTKSQPQRERQPIDDQNDSDQTKNKPGGNRYVKQAGLGGINQSYDYNHGSGHNRDQQDSLYEQ